ncbi:hypothetical protein TWF281_002004 [Arthrobotrys megalospora]
MAKNPPRIVLESPIDHESLTEALSDDEGDSSFFRSLASVASTPSKPATRRRSLEAPTILDPTRLMATNLRPLNFSRGRRVEHRRQPSTLDNPAPQQTARTGGFPNFYDLRPTRPH